MSNIDLGKKEKIMNAAIKVFAKKGYVSCRTLDISKKAGVAYGSLYLYFKNKDDILFSIYRDNWNFLLRKMEQSKQSKVSPVTQIIEISNFIFENYEHNPDRMKVMLMDVPKLIQFYGEEGQALYYRFYRGLTEIISKGQKEGLINKEVSPAKAAFVIFGAVDNLIRQYVFNPHFEKLFFPVEEAKNWTSKFIIPKILNI